MNKKLGLEGWRPRGLFSDEYLEARMAALDGYDPETDVMLAEPPAPVAYDPLGRDEVRRALAKACPVDDVFSFVLEQWPDRTLSEILQVFGWIHRGNFGPSLTPEDTDERAYSAGSTTVYAWPVALERVES